MGIEKTNAARLLDNAKIEYSLIAYKLNESDLSAVHVARELNEPVHSVFKTLVLQGDKSGYFVCIIPGAEELDFKKAARASGNKSCELIPLKMLMAATGYIRGACSPLGMKRHFPIYIHESCFEFNQIFISAGKRGLQLRLAPSDLIAVTDATVESLC